MTTAAVNPYTAWMQAERDQREQRALKRSCKYCGAQVSRRTTTQRCATCAYAQRESRPRTKCKLCPHHIGKNERRYWVMQVEAGGRYGRKRTLLSTICQTCFEKPRSR